MKFTFLIIFLGLFSNLSFSQNPQQKNAKEDIFCSYKEFLKEINILKISKVEAYNFNCNHIKQKAFDYKLIDSNRQITSTASNKKVLSNKERSMLMKIINKKKNYISIVAESKGCYNPRMGFVFYNSNIIIAHLDICLECNQILFESYSRSYLCQTDFYAFGKNRFKSLCEYFKLGCCN